MYGCKRGHKKKSLEKYITSRDGLSMKKVACTFTGKKIGSTFFIVSKTIDAVWEAPDIVVVGVCGMPLGYGAGDHRLSVLDLLTSSLIGQSPPRIMRSGARRLNTKIPSTKDN